MRSALSALAHMVAMAAIVATLVYLPAGVLTALIFRLLGIPFVVWLTFGGALHAAIGLLAWWLLIFVSACGYAAWVFPWGDKALTWRGGK